MFCFKCGASMPEDATVCPQCATPVQAAPTPPPPPQQPTTPNPASTSAWLNVPPAPAQQSPQYPPQGQPYPEQPPSAHRPTVKPRQASSWVSSLSCAFQFLPEYQPSSWDIFPRRTSSRVWDVSRVTEWQPTGLIMGYISAAAIPLILIIAAIAIPNLLRARISANEAAAASTVRTINTTQITYSTSYPDHGYAPDLATLGPGPSGSCSTAHGTTRLLARQYCRRAAVHSRAVVRQDGYNFHRFRAFAIQPDVPAPIM